MGKFNTDAIKVQNRLQPTIEKLTGVVFKKIGNYQFCKCPLHGEDTPSFHIKESEPDFFMCEGCRASGDVIKFVMLLKNMEFKEACELLGGDTDLDPMEARRFEDERRAENDARIAREQAELAASRARFNATRIWETYHDAMKDEDRSWWEGRGIRPDWQDFFGVGAVENLWAHYGKAFSIPYSAPNLQIITCQYRFKTPNGLGPYRFEPDLGKGVFIARPDIAFKRGNVLCVEGAIKAMVTAQVMAGTDWQVIGIPDKYHTGGIIDELKSAKHVYIWLDPDAWAEQKNDAKPFVPWPVHHAKEIGPHVRVVQYPEKIDDWIIWKDASKDDIFDVMRMARRA